MNFRESCVNDDEDDSRETIEAVRKTFTGWTPDDYRATLDIYKELKRKQNELVIKFFTEEVVFSNGISVADWAMGKK